MNNFLNYPKRKFSANGKLQPSARRTTQQDVEVLAAKRVWQHGDAGQGRGWAFQCLPCAGFVLARLMSGLSAVGAKFLEKGTVHHTQGSR